MNLYALTVHVDISEQNRQHKVVIVCRIVFVEEMSGINSTKCYITQSIQKHLNQISCQNGNTYTFQWWLRKPG